MTHVVFAPDTALERLDGDRELLGEIISLLLEDVPAQLDILRAGGDPVALGRVAHGLRGAVSNVGGAAMVASIRPYEDAAKHGEAARLPSLFAEIERQWNALLPELLGFSAAA